MNWGKAFYIGAPAIIAGASALGLLLWMFGASAVDGTEAQGWTLGFWALLGYATLYQGLLVLLLLGWLMRWPIGAPIHTAIWTATVIFLAVMAHAFRQLDFFGH
ncbi:hypothetical protein [Devosia sp. A369]